MVSPSPEGPWIGAIMAHPRQASPSHRASAPLNHVVNEPGESGERPPSEYARPALDAFFGETAGGDSPSPSAAIGNTLLLGLRHRFRPIGSNPGLSF